MSAFCAAGREGACFQDMRFLSKRHNAKVDRIGRMVKVYRKESRQRMNPNPMIWITHQLRAEE